MISITDSETHKHTLEHDRQPKTLDSTINARCGDLNDFDNRIRHIRYTEHGRLVYRVTEQIQQITVPVRTLSFFIHGVDLNSEFA